MIRAIRCTPGYPVPVTECRRDQECDHRDEYRAELRGTAAVIVRSAVDGPHQPGDVRSAVVALLDDRGGCGDAQGHDADRGPEGVLLRGGEHPVRGPEYDARAQGEQTGGRGAPPSAVSSAQHGPMMSSPIRTRCGRWSRPGRRLCRRVPFRSSSAHLAPVESTTKYSQRPRPTQPDRSEPVALVALDVAARRRSVSSDTDGPARLARRGRRVRLRAPRVQ